MASKITVKLVRSVCNKPQKMKDTVRGLGLRKLGSSKTLENTACVRGMIKKVINFIEVTE